MSNPSFYKKSAPYKISEIIRLVEKELISPPSDYEDILIYDIKALEDAKRGDISFLINNKYFSQLREAKASCCVIPSEVPLSFDNEIILLRAKNPQLVYSILVDLFYKPTCNYPNKIMPSAYIASSAVIGANCYIGHNVVIEENVVIGDNSIIEAGTFIGHGVVIGNNALIYSNVSISYSIIGDNVVILPGARLGQDGFGFATNQQGIHKKIFHTGIVRIGNNVEIGSNTTIDRGSAKDTIIEDLCRLDNLVQIAHNVVIGKGSIVVAQVGIAGSTKIGSYCTLGGQVGIAGHLTVGDKAQLAARAGVMKDVEAGSKVGGSPALPIKEWLRQCVRLKQLTSKGEKASSN